MSDAAVEDWRGRGERERAAKRERLRRDALRRLARMAPRRVAAEAPPTAAERLVLDCERLAAPLAERLGPRDRVRIVLWAGLAAVLGCALGSFFSAPLMGAGLAWTALLVAGMLAVSYLI